MFVEILLLIIGLILLVKGADFFVEGSSSIAKTLKIPPLIIGLTLVSIGTSLPELSVSITSSINGLNDMSFGNVIGSNIFNTLIVIGCSALILPLAIHKNIFRFDLPISFLIYILLILFSFVISPYEISLVESIILIIIFITYIVTLIIREKKENHEATQIKDRKLPVSIVLTVIGIIGVIVGGNFVVNSASKIASSLGMSELLVGLTIVAIGTSLPELVTSVIASKKHQNDIAIGNAIGSNIFNVLFILGLSSSLNTINIDNSIWFDLVILLISTVILFIFSIKDKTIKRYHGLILILVYVVYFTYIIIRNIGLF